MDSRWLEKMKNVARRGKVCAVAGAEKCRHIRFLFRDEINAQTVSSFLHTSPIEIKNRRSHFCQLVMHFTEALFLRNAINANSIIRIKTHFAWPEQRSNDVDKDLRNKLNSGQQFFFFFEWDNSGTDAFYCCCFLLPHQYAVPFVHVMTNVMWIDDALCTFDWCRWITRSQIRQNLFFFFRSIVCSDLRFGLIVFQRWTTAACRGRRYVYTRKREKERKIAFRARHYVKCGSPWTRNNQTRLHTMPRGESGIHQKDRQRKR